MRKVTISGIESSGSTAVWQVACRLLRRNVDKNHGFQTPGDGIVIGCYRDFRDVVSSLFCRGVLDNTDWLREDMSVGEKLVQYCKYIHVRFGELAQYHHHPNAVLLRYESWCGNTEILTAIMCGLLEINFDEVLFKDAVRYSSIPVNYNRSLARRGHGDYDPATRIHGRHISQGGAVGAWQKIFALADDASIDSMKLLLGEPLKEFGYGTW